MRKLWALYDMNVYTLTNEEYEYVEPKVKIEYHTITRENLNEVAALRNFTRKKEFLKLLKQKKAIGIAASIENKIVGYGWVKFSGSHDKFFNISENKAYLSSFFVGDDWRGKAIYPNLISYLTAMVIEKYDIKKIFIAIDKDNYASIAGVNKVGFKKIFESKSYRILKLTWFKNKI